MQFFILLIFSFGFLDFLQQQKGEDCFVQISEEKTVENEIQKRKDETLVSGRVHRELVESNSDAYKPILISIGPYHIKHSPSSEREIKDIKEAFYSVFFGGSEEGHKERCREKLRDLKDMALSWYANDYPRMNDDQFLEMLLLDGCFILQFFFELMKPEEADRVAFVKVGAKVAQTLRDLLLFENQIPFFVLFELYKLKCSNRYNNEADALKVLIVIVKACFADRVPKFTPKNLIENKYEPAHLPKHLLEVVHSLCIPRNNKDFEKDSGKEIGDILQQINTATELEKEGVSFKKIGYVYIGSSFDKNDNTTLFDIDFNKGILKIPCFKIGDHTETFLRNMIAYEQHSAVRPKYFSDFACFMDQLINSIEDVNLLRRRGIILNLLATDHEVTQIFNNLGKGVMFSSTFSQLINHINRHGDQAWNIWMGKLRQDCNYSPCTLIKTIVGGLIFALGAALTIKNLLK